uniref:Uncharacterized protein n=1 Tax=Periophthalmus magnuspinnatus TaxID=409849 RepID=A0A3B4BD66_9GOBI
MCFLRMTCPPSKRSRGLGPVLDLDPFDEDFTQDDLNEIDIIASQAITMATGGVATATATAASGQGHNGFTGEFRHGSFLIQSYFNPHTQVVQSIIVVT